MENRLRIEIIQTPDGNVSFEAINHTKKAKCPMTFTQEQISKATIGTPEWCIKELLRGADKMVK